MNAVIVVLFAMEFVSLMLAVILVTAWNSFGRPRHALTWCVAFVVAAIGWAGNILLVGSVANELLLRFAVHLLAMATWAIMLLGFRQRAGLATRGWPMVLTLALPVAALAAASLTHRHGFIGAIPPLFAATMLTLSAGTMIRRGGRNQAERAVITMLLAFAFLDLFAGGIALRQGISGGGGQLLMFNTLMVLTIPSAFIGTGLFAVFLLAADLAERMGRLAASDPLTGALNRRGFEEAAARAVANARRQRQPLTVVVADLDRFKSVNDRHGHGVGDAVICRFVEHVAGSIRAGDLFGRIGGEEFAMVLVDAAPAAAFDAIERIRAALALIEIPAGAGTIRVTASFGLTGPSSPAEEMPAMLGRADRALYQSKLAGRDRVTLIAAPAAEVPSDVSTESGRGHLRLAAVNGTAAR